MKKMPPRNEKFACLRTLNNKLPPLSKDGGGSFIAQPSSAVML